MATENFCTLLACAVAAQGGGHCLHPGVKECGDFYFLHGLLASSIRRGDLSLLSNHCQKSTLCR
jgi:hypothetical protein